MNDIDAFVGMTLAIFVALTLLIWLLTRLEQTLLDPPADRRRSSLRPASSQDDPNDPCPNSQGFGGEYLGG